jgi:hypothetical protein
LNGQGIPPGPDPTKDRPTKDRPMKTYEITQAQEPTRRPWNVSVDRQMAASFETRKEAKAWIASARHAEKLLDDFNYVGSRHHY